MRNFNAIYLSVGVSLALCSCQFSTRLRVPLVNVSNTPNGLVAPRLSGASTLNGASASESGGGSQNGTVGNPPCPTGYCLPLNANGWTILSPSANTRVVYVSSSTGNDLNDGLAISRAKRTIAAAKALIRDGYPDWMLLKPGDVFNNDVFGNWCPSGASPAQPIVLASYEALTGNYSPSVQQPVLQLTTGIGFEPANFCAGQPHHVQNVVISGIHFKGTSQWAGGSGITIYSSDNTRTGHNHILLEDVTIDSLNSGLTLVGTAGSSPVTGLGRIQYVTVRRSRIFDIGTPYVPGVVSSSLGVVMDASDHILFSQMVMDQNGWEFDTVTGRARYNSLNGHNFYAYPFVSTDIVNDGNISARASATGYRACVGTCTNNLMLKNPIAMDFSTDSLTVKDNVVLGAQDIYNPAYPDSACLHGRCGRAWGIGGKPGTGAQITGNIVANNENGTESIQAYAFDISSANQLNFSNNLAYKWSEPAPATQTYGGAEALHIVRNTPNAVVSGMSMRNNVFYQPNYGGMIYLDPGLLTGANPIGITFASNIYFTPSPYPFAETSFLTQQNWRTITQDTSLFAQPAFPNPNRSTIATYLVDRLSVATGTDATETFMNLVRSQRRGNWNEALTAGSVNGYIRGALTSNQSSLCARADLNGDGRWDILDFGLFQNLFVLQDPRTDFNGDGLFNIYDFSSFQQAISSCSQ